MSDVAQAERERRVARGPEITFDDVHSRWASGDWPGRQESEALSGISLTLPAGQITVLLGDHGSGKSLLALHLLGEVAPDRGQVRVGDESLWELPEQQRRDLHDSFGVLRGGTAIRESETSGSSSVAENLTRQLRDTGAGDRAEAAARDCLDHFDLGELADAKPDDLDSSAKRRLAVAVALADDPSVVVIDDPGEAFDLAHLEDMVEAIEGWHARTGATMLITVHSLRLARDLGQQVVVLRDGEVIAHGTPEEVLDGVVDDQSYEQRFGSEMGGASEGDPERGRREMKLHNLTQRRWHIAFVVAFFVAAIVIIVAMLTSGLLDQGTNDQGGDKATTSHGPQTPKAG